MRVSCGWAWGVALAVLAGAAHARVVEEQIDVPVQVKNPWGKQIAQDIRVTVWSDDTNPRPAPIALINHGRAPDAQGRASLGRARPWQWLFAARWYAAGALATPCLAPLCRANPHLAFVRWGKAARFFTCSSSLA